MALLTLATVIFIESRGWPKAVDVAGDPTLVARALAMLMLPIAAILFLRPGLADDATGEPGKVLLAVAIMAAFGAAMPWLGLPLTGVFALLALQRLNGVGWQRAIVAAVIVMTLIWGSFVTLLHVPLPAGTIWTSLTAAFGL
ncbi:tripartite tricarboxylate transporter TctB family protein [Bosea sp. PAMC 26642]|uniref:tripartite tricarboxylate transporter TctB family protein n=1 Tax=Bosea sp. (strain PAMC 26642) TaxID=1792307 RepID=UPI0014388B10|nr:tripartite tricarboxylate transporter TctB family protein [Bosea sp. PAMC 26642]